MTDSRNGSSAGSDRALLAPLVHDAMRFAIWAAGEGITPVDGQPARAPEDFLYEYSCATDIEDWDGLAEVARDAVTGDDAQQPSAHLVYKILGAVYRANGSTLNDGQAVREAITEALASQPSPAATVETVETISKTDAGELINTIAAQADIIAKLAAMVDELKAQPHSSAGNVADLIERLRNPMWAHSTAPFPGPQLEQEENLAAMNEAAAWIERLTAVPQAAQLSNLVTWTYLYAIEGEAWPDHKTIIAPLIELSKHEPTQADADLLKAGGSLKGLVALSLTRPQEK